VEKGVNGEGKEGEDGRMVDNATKREDVTRRKKKTSSRAKKEGRIKFIKDGGSWQKSFRGQSDAGTRSTIVIWGKREEGKTKWESYPLSQKRRGTYMYRGWVKKSGMKKRFERINRRKKKAKQTEFINAKSEERERRCGVNKSDQKLVKSVGTKVDVRPRWI